MKIEVNKDTVKEFVAAAGSFAGCVGFGFATGVASEVIKASMPKNLKWLGNAFWLASIIPGAAAIIKREDDLRPYTDEAVDAFADLGKIVKEKISK